MSYIFTSESVSEGHPDKLCDRVSDTVLDLFLAAEPEARVACETFATSNRVILGGEVRASKDNLASIMAAIEPAVRAAVKDIGYEQEKFHHAHFEFQNYLHEQSADIAMGVDSGDNKDEGAGDQGLMFGYACRETDALMPAAIHYSHQILKRLAEMRKGDADSILGPDSKSQISLIYDDEGRPTGAHKIVLSTQHDEAATQRDIRALVTPVIAAVNGTAAGAGFSLLMAADLAIAAESAVMTMAYTNAGLSPDGSSTYYMPRKIGDRRARELMLTNRVLNAQEALDWGVVNQVVADEDALPAAQKLAAKLAQGPTQAYGQVKALLDSSFDHSRESQMEFEARAIAELVGSADGQEGLHAFLDKRKPQFHGR